jgi:hypothetical protein
MELPLKEAAAATEMSDNAVTEVTGVQVPAADSFVSVDNFKVLMQVFREHVRRKHACDVEQLCPDVNCSTVLYDTMLVVQKEFEGNQTAMGDMNNVALNMITRYYEQRSSIVASSVTTASLSTLTEALPVPVPFAAAAALLPEASLGGGGGGGGVAEKYISINSFDREWTLSPARYSYSVSMLNPLREVHTISVGVLILPAEIRDVPAVHHVAKSSFLHNYNLDVPYVVMRVDELGDMYSGANERLNRGFCKLVYDKSYCTSYGRAFIVLKSMQPEVKVFEPSTTVQRLTISILRPNGDLLNESRDDHQLFKLEHEAYNPTYLKVITCKYFDKNDFYVGDNIQMRDFVITPLLGPNGPKEVAESGLETVVNRWSGHDIRQLGRPNDEGFYRWFYIDAPSQFSEATGRREVRTDLVQALQDYNDRTALDDIARPGNGKLLNMSLQNSVSFTVGIRGR